MHHKYTIVDATTVLTGSLDLSGNGLEVNHENMVVLRGGESPDKYAANFVGEVAASSPYFFLLAFIPLFINQKNKINMCCILTGFSRNAILPSLRIPLWV